MTDALLFTETGDVRILEVDPDRDDVLCDLLDAHELTVYDLPTIAVRLMFRTERRDARMNLPVSLLAYAAGRPLFHPVLGPVLAFGTDADHATTDVPDSLLALFDLDLTP